MSAEKRELLTIDRDAIARAFVLDHGQVDDETLSRVTDAMAATARAVLHAKGVDVRVSSKMEGGSAGRTSSHTDAAGRREKSDVVLAGQGLPPPIGSAEGISRLRRQAVVLPFEQWAGKVLGPKKAAEVLGVRRSTLDNWRTKGEIIALPKGKSAHVIPMAQFREGRPIGGIGRVLEIAHGSASLAWSWLMTPHVDFDAEPPLQALAAGQEDAVCAAAERSIG